MDESRFDALAKGLVVRSAARRSVVRALAVAAVGGVVTRGEVVAGTPRCPGRTGCNAQCRNTKKTCSCVHISGGKRVCVHPCCSNRTCTKNSQCRNGEVCLKTNCCGGRVCVTRCTEPKPRYCSVQSIAAGSAWG